VSKNNDVDFDVALCSLCCCLCHRCCCRSRSYSNGVTANYETIDGQGVGEEEDGEGESGRGRERKLQIICSLSCGSAAGVAAG